MVGINPWGVWYDFGVSRRRFHSPNLTLTIHMNLLKKTAREGLVLGRSVMLNATQPGGPEMHCSNSFNALGKSHQASASSTTYLAPITIRLANSVVNRRSS